MNSYQQKWIDVLKIAHRPGWKIEALQDDIYVEMPHVTNLKLIRDNLPATLGSMALDIDVPKERLNLYFIMGMKILNIY